MLKKNILFIVIFAMHLGAAAQKPLLQDKEEIVAKAKSDLDSSMASGELRKFALKSGIKGEYIMDITIHEKGKVLTVFTVSNNTDDLMMQNQLKDFVKTLVFSFKMPAGKPYKFQYTFHFG